MKKVKPSMLCYRDADMVIAESFMDSVKDLECSKCGGYPEEYVSRFHPPCTCKKTSDFKKGQRVRYVPRHAEGDENHKDCQEGAVSSTNDSWVFVKYDNLDCRMLTGDEPYTAQATDPNDLRLL
jgi:hypothetical protein